MTTLNVVDNTEIKTFKDLEPGDWFYHSEDGDRVLCARLWNPVFKHKESISKAPCNYIIIENMEVYRLEDNSPVTLLAEINVTT